jgi:phosphoribosylglycinamide formyltransferase-1
MDHAALLTFHILRVLPMTFPLPIGILISGSGTNLLAIIDAIERKEVSAVIRVVISNRADAYGLERARRHSIPAIVIPHKNFSSREIFESELVTVLKKHGVELVVLAGFMRVLSPFFIRLFPQRIMNIHPGLLPSFPGTHAQRQALERGVRIAGATVHFVDEETDHGPIIIQAAVPVYPDDTEETLSARILMQEHRIYPQAIQLYAEERLTLQGSKVIVLNEPRSPRSTLSSPL